MRQNESLRWNIGGDNQKKNCSFYFKRDQKNCFLSICCGLKCHSIKKKDAKYTKMRISEIKKKKILMNFHARSKREIFANLFIFFFEIDWNLMPMKRL